MNIEFNCGSWFHHPICCCSLMDWTFGHSKRENEDKWIGFWIRSLDLMLTYIKKIGLISFTLSCYLFKIITCFFYCWRCKLQCLFFVFFVWIDCVCNVPFRIIWPHEINLEHVPLQCYNGSFSFGDLLNLISSFVKQFLDIF